MRISGKRNIIRILLAAIFSFTFISSAAAQKETGSEQSYSKARVKFDGYELFYVRGVASYPAEERAEAISLRIEEAANDPSLSPDSIQVISREDYDEIILGTTPIMRVLDSDASIEGVRRSSLSQGIKYRITKALYTYRYERSSSAIIKNSLKSAGAIALFIICSLLIRFGAKRAKAGVETRLKLRFEKFETKSFNLIRSNQILLTLTGFIRSVKYILITILLFITAQYVLGMFPWTRGISVSLFGMIIQPFREFGKALVNFIPDLLFLVVIFLITRYLLKIVKLLFQGLGQGTISLKNFESEWAPTTYKIVRLLLVAFAVIVAYPYIPGSDSEAFKGVSLFLGILFSLGSTSVIGNLIAGYTMTYRKTFKVGDSVQIENSIGEVVDIKLFVTRIRTYKNEEVIIPNSQILSNNVINYSTYASGKGLIIHTTVGIGYETSWRLVESMLKEAADRTTGIQKDPPPYVLQKGLGDFAVTYEINGYIKEPLKRIKIYNELHQNILDVFNENNVQIMTPAYEGDPEKPKVVPKNEWFMPLSKESNDKQQDLFDKLRS